MCVERSMLSLSTAAAINTLLRMKVAVSAAEDAEVQETPQAAAAPMPYDTGFHRLVYYLWGDPQAERTVVCMHGFARNGRDFDFLAERLSSDSRVICPDLPGRGRSDWLDEQQAGSVSNDRGYNYLQYMHDAASLIAHLDVMEVDWVGTSLGGLLGMMLAAQPQSPIKRLVMNDVGAFVPAAVSKYLATYIGQDPDFATPAELETRLREIYGGEEKFGNLTDTQWRQLAHCSERLKAQGLLGFAFDPKLGSTYVPPFYDVDLWAIWERVRCPVLVLRGANSFVLSEETAERMRSSGPRATVVEIPHCGHAPALMSAEQIATIGEWLKKGKVSETPHSFLGTARATVAELVGAR